MSHKDMDILQQLSTSSVCCVACAWHNTEEEHRGQDLIMAGRMSARSQKLARCGIYEVACLHHHLAMHRASKEIQRHFSTLACTAKSLQGNDHSHGTCLPG